MIWTDPLPYFPRNELECRGTRELDEEGEQIPGTGVILLDGRFAALLPALRQRWGGPLSPTSVCRTPAHNIAEKGHPRSLHLTKNPVHPTNGCMAADLYWRTWNPAKKLEFCRMAFRSGWSIGLNATFVHIDLRELIGLNRGVFEYSNWDHQFNKEDIY